MESGWISIFAEVLSAKNSHSLSDFIEAEKV